MLPPVLVALVLLQSMAIPPGLSRRLRIALFFGFGAIGCIFAFAVHSFLAHEHWTFAAISAMAWLIVVIAGLGILALLRWLDKMQARWGNPSN
jgi:hypothetical protein